MKVCPTCSSTTFDDMNRCYTCLQPLDGGIALEDVRKLSGVQNTQAQTGLDDAGDRAPEILDLEIEEPQAAVAPEKPQAVVAFEEPQTMSTEIIGSLRFHVVMPELFAYDIYMQKSDASTLTVGCSRDNNIVLPHTLSRRHLLKLYSSQAQVWVENMGSKQRVKLDGVPLTGTRSMNIGSVIKIGKARIELVEA